MNKKPIYYKQSDPKWGKISYTIDGDKNETIGASGCGPTSAAMIIASVKDAKITPVEMCKLAIELKDRTANNGTEWEFFKKVAARYNISFKQSGSTKEAIEALKAGAYVVCSMGPGKFTKGGHFILAWDYMDSNIIVHDPANESQDRTYGNIKTFETECKQYFIFFVKQQVDRVLKQGCTGDDVYDLQLKLKNLGYVMATDGIFGVGTKKCVIEFQKLNGLVADGIIGTMTKARITIAKPIPYQVLQYNKYIRIIKIRKASILKCDVVDSKGAKETVKSMFARVKPTIMINGGLYGMANGVSLSKFFDKGKKITDGIFSDFSFVVDKDGRTSFKYVHPGESVENDALGASPSLIINSKRVIDIRGLEKDYAFLNSRHPRMAIGEDKDFIYIVCVHGRKILLGYRGMTITELADLGEQLELGSFMNVDGGGSAIVLGPDGKPLNDPLENRAVDNGLAFWLEV